MSNASTGYSVRLVYYGRADFHESDAWADGSPRRNTKPLPEPQVSTQNIRIVAFPSSSETMDMIGVYELVKNAEAPKSDLEGTKL